MKLEIGKPKKVRKIKNVFEFKLEWMMGDADGDLVETILVDKDDPLLERFLIFLDALHKTFAKKGMAGYDMYDSENTNDFWLFAGEDEDVDTLTEEQIKLVENNGIQIEVQHDQNGNQCSFQGYEVSFFDENGVECNVKIKKK